ncbi:MAG: alpha-glucan family phosphorylase [Acidimicrobiia bacterium]|nr:alpha-glucan family phosphorylase [Acidimicrobiia bacterium]
MDSLFTKIPVGPGATPIRLPREYSRLVDLAANQWWIWNPEGYELWGRIDPQKWAATRNPLTLLQIVEPSTWDALRTSASFAEAYDTAMDRFDAYMDSEETWFDQNHGEALDGPIAYLCAEFGLHQTLPFYSGGLGVLAGDHLKAASDLGLPLVAVGLFYRRGYFQQSVDPDGHQQHEYPHLEPTRRPIRPVLDRSGHPLRVSIELPGRTVHVGAVRVDVGRIPLLLLDTDVPENDPADRPITQILYVRGREMRLHQEIVLGVGGARILEALELEPAVWHVNEGHSAFSLLERTAWAQAAGVEDPIESVQQDTLFTLHTPVPAGNEVFDGELVARYLTTAIPGTDREELLAKGRFHADRDHLFDMSALAIRHAAKINGVSKRHGEVVAADWADLVGDRSGAVTNGIHVPTWLGRNVSRLYADKLGTDWVTKLAEPEAWEAIHEIELKSIWNAHSQQKNVMLRNLRNRLVQQAARHGESPDRLRWLDDQLPEDRLTIGFARRFATYKRAGLLFSDVGRLRALLTNPERPVQLVFAGKAHPADREGQGLIRWVSEIAATADIEGHIFFIENYDMSLGRALVTGCDVWLNTPRPPMEASGTSGMKAAANGGLNVSVLDGWWAEAFDGSNGWGFGEHSYSDAEDAGYLYHLLESEVVPRFFDRGADGVPKHWAEMMRHSMATLTQQFSAHRMLIDYATQAYVPLGSS